TARDAPAPAAGATPRIAQEPEARGGLQLEQAAGLVGRGVGASAEPDTGGLEPAVTKSDREGALVERTETPVKPVPESSERAPVVQTPERAPVDVRRDAGERPAAAEPARAEAAAPGDDAFTSNDRDGDTQDRRPRDDGAPRREDPARVETPLVKQSGVSPVAEKVPARSEGVVVETREPVSVEARRVERAPAPSTAESAPAPAPATQAAPTIEKGSVTVAQRESPTLATAARSEAPPPVEAQVSRGIGAALAQRGGSITLRLAPESLGHVRVSMHVSRGDVTLDLEATTERAHRVLTQELASLRASLESRGLRVEKAQVHLAPAPVQAGGAEANTTRGASGDAHQQQREQRDDDGQQHGQERRRERQRGGGGSFGSFAQEWDPESFAIGLNASA
ncbi:MAG: flagellar hook-length control protein FliK, partial [Planctomycetota bacterium]